MTDPDSDTSLERIRLAMTALVSERTYPEVTLDLLLGRAGVERAVFERHFSDLDACFTAAWLEAAEAVQLRMFEAYDGAGTWREGMRAQAWVFCRFLQADHDRARVVMVALTFAPERVRAARDERFRLFANLIHLGTMARPEAADVPFAQAEAIAGAIWDTASKLVDAGRFEDLPKQVPELMFIAVLPYLGLEAAKEETSRAPEDIARYERGEL